jgi:hypothetical protein
MKKSDKTIRRIRVKNNQILELRPEKDSALFYRFTMFGMSRIGKLEVYSEENFPQGDKLK